MTNRWFSREPIQLPRWVLQIKYFLFIILAGLVAARGLVTLSATTPPDYTGVWCAALALGSVVAFIASFHPRHERTEKWAAVWIAAWLTVIAVASIAEGHRAGFWIVVIVTCLPAGRAISLFSRKRDT